MTNNQSKEDLEARLARLEKKVKDFTKDKEIKEIIFCEVIFDPAKFMIGQKKCNLLLKKGFQVYRNWPTDGGLVIQLGRYGSKAK